MKEFLLCINEDVLLFGSPPSGWDTFGCLFAGLADHQAVVTPPAGFICPLGFSHFFPERQYRFAFILLEYPLEEYLR